MSLATLAALADRPKRWRELDAETLGHLLVHQCLAYGFESEERRAIALQGLVGIAAERLDVGQRRGAVASVSRVIDRVHRERGIRHGAGLTNALLPFLFVDPDPRVVADAATEMAALMPLADGDPLTGPRHVRTIADESRTSVPRAAIVAAILRFGDSRLLPLVDGAWRDLDLEGARLLASMCQAPHAATIEFYLRWVEDAQRRGSEYALGAVLGALSRIARAATERGVTDVEHVFPRTERPMEESVRVAERCTGAEFTARISGRLGGIAARERYPRVSPRTLRDWGLEDGPFVETLEQAVTEPGGMCRSVSPVPWRAPKPIDVFPDWNRHDRLLEWGTFDPRAPVLHQLIAVLLPRIGCLAVVSVRHHPFEPACHVVGCLPGGATADGQHRFLRELFARNGTDRAPLLRALPDYVFPMRDGVFDPPFTTTLFHGAHRHAVEHGDAPFEDPIWAASDAMDLAHDPWGTALARGGDARRGADGPSPLGRLWRGLFAARPRADLATYRAWLDVVASPVQVSRVRGEVPRAWAAAVDAAAAASREHLRVDG